MSRGPPGPESLVEVFSPPFSQRVAPLSPRIHVGACYHPAIYYCSTVLVTRGFVDASRLSEMRLIAIQTSVCRKHTCHSATPMSTAFWRAFTGICIMFSHQGYYTISKTLDASRLPTRLSNLLFAMNSPYWFHSVTSA